MAREHLLVVGWGAGRGWNSEKLRDIPICFRRITFITPPETHTTNRTRYLKTLIKKKMSQNKNECVEL